MLTAVSDGMVALLKAVIERETGRDGGGFTSGNQQHPTMMCEVFILATADLVELHELPVSEPSSSAG